MYFSKKTKKSKFVDMKSDNAGFEKVVDSGETTQTNNEGE